MAALDVIWRLKQSRQTIKGAVPIPRFIANRQALLIRSLCKYGRSRRRRKRKDKTNAHPQPPTAQRAQKPPSTSNFARNATTTTQPSDRGRKTFQPIRISWS